MNVNYLFPCFEFRIARETTKFPSDEKLRAGLVGMLPSRRKNNIARAKSIFSEVFLSSPAVPLGALSTRIYKFIQRNTKSIYCTNFCFHCRRELKVLNVFCEPNRWNLNIQMLEFSACFKLVSIRCCERRQCPRQRINYLNFVRSFHTRFMLICELMPHSADSFNNSLKVLHSSAMV